MTPRIPPKNAQEFSPGNVIRLEFPAQGYVNPGKTTLEFDAQILYTFLDSTDRTAIRFQNNIQSMFSRVRLLYGSTPLEDIPNYMKKEIEQYAKNRNYVRILIVDCHNAMGEEISKEDGEDMLKAAKSCLETLITKENY